MRFGSLVLLALVAHRLPAQLISWGRDTVHAQQTWATGNRGQNIRVAVFGAGITPARRAAFHIVGERNYLSFEDGVPFPTEDSTNATDRGGCGGHDTGTLSEIASGDYGVAPSVEVLVVRMAGPINGVCSGSSTALWRGIDWAVSQGARIISVSYDFGSAPMEDRWVAEAIQRARNAGVLIFAPTGNYGESFARWPARDTNVIAVGAVDDHLQRASFSNLGAELLAPGVNIPSYADNSVGSGTSRAVPIAAGVAALHWAAAPMLSADTIRARLQATARVLPDGLMVRAPSTPWPVLQPGFQARSMVVRGVTLNYQVFIPANYSPAQAWPVVLFMHGSGERGNNNTSQVGVGLGYTVQAQAATFPAVVIFPQVPLGNPVLPGVTDFYGQGINDIMQTALDSTLRFVHADSSRLYLTGVSMGGFATYAFAYLHPTLFAAIAPVSGGVVTAGISNGVNGSNTTANQILAGQNIAARLRDVPIWAWHGDADGTVPIATYEYPIRDAFAAIGGGQYQLHVGIGRGHELEVNYQDPAFWSWLWAQRKGACTPISIVGPAIRSYTAPTMDSVQVTGTCPWTASSSRSNAVRRGNYLVFHAVAGDTILLTSH